MTKQDDKLRARRKLQTQAVELAAKNRWEEAVEINRQILELGEDADTFNRLGKALFEVGKLEEARDCYRSALRLTPTNPIARKNVERIEELIARGGATAPQRAGRELVDLRLFITEIGKSALTSLVDVPRRPTGSAVVTGERVEIQVDGRNVNVYDTSGNVIGRIEPKLAQRLISLLGGGNKYAAAVAYVGGHQIRVLLRETFQAPGMRDRVSFPGKLSEGALRGFVAGASYDDYSEDILDDDDSGDDREEVEEETFSNEEEDLGLDEIEQDITEEEDMGEE